MVTGEPIGPPWKGTVQVVELATGRYWAAWTDAGDRIEKEGKAFAVQVFVQVNTAAEYLPVRMFDGTFIEIRQWIRGVRTQEQLHRPSAPTRVSKRPR